MPSASDYILAKKIIAIKKNVDLISSLDNQNCYNNCNSTVIGNDFEMVGPQGPPGEPGDRYLTSFKEIIHKYVLDTGSISVQIEPGLAYIHGQPIICMHDTSKSPYDNFSGTVFNYDKTTGVMIINNINTISEGFIYSTERTYKLTLDNRANNNDQSNQLPISISMDNQIDIPCYPNFTEMTHGELKKASISNNITFTPINGELTVNALYENNSPKINIEPLADNYSLQFIRTLYPKKYSFSNKPTVSRFGFLGVDISNAHVNENLGIVKNNAICYSEIMAPIVSVLKNVLDRLDSIEERILKIEQDSQISFNSSSTPIATNYEISSSTPLIAYLSAAPSETEISTPLHDIPNSYVDISNDVNVENNIITEDDSINNLIEISQSQTAAENNDNVYLPIDNARDFIHLINQAKQNYSSDTDIQSI